MKNQFDVTLTMIYNHTVRVEADNGDEALKYVNDNLDTLAPDAEFTFGEKTADYAEPVENE